jgi:predicted Fe-Mo cluster-binding NifX family protein
MKVAIPIRNGRISPVFDVATRLLVVDFVNGEPGERSEFSIRESGGEVRAELLQELGVKILICGAISNQTARIIKRCGIDLRPWVVGEIDDVIDAYTTCSLDSEGFIMPGCRRGQGGGRGGGQGGGRGGRQGNRQGKRSNGHGTRRESGGRRNRE